MYEPFPHLWDLIFFPCLQTLENMYFEKEERNNFNLDAISLGQGSISV